MPASVWLTARQRDFTGGENLSLLPEKVGRNQFIRMENAIISPQGEVTAPWQMDKPLFVNVASGIVLVPIAGSRLYTVYAVATGGVIQFTVDPQNPVPYDMANASGCPGYVFHAHVSPVSILGISHGTPFLGKHYCCASTSLYITGGELTANAVGFPTIQNTLVATADMTVTNNTVNPVTLTGAAISGDSSVFTHSGVFPHTIAPGASYAIPITFSPTAVGAYSATIDIKANIGILQKGISGESANLLALYKAEGVNVPATGISLEPVPVGSISAKAVTLKYTGTGNITVSSAVFTGYDASACQLVVRKGGGVASPLPVTFSPGEYVNFEVYMTMNSVGPKTAALVITTNVQTLTVPITGTGT